MQRSPLEGPRVLLKFKKALRNLMLRTGYRLVPVESTGLPSDFSRQDAAIIKAVEGCTMTSSLRLHGLIQAVNYIVDHGLEGDLVEAGVWRGGSMMAVALTLLERGIDDRDLYLFDTYEGMPRPDGVDVFHTGESAEETFQKHRISDRSSAWCRAQLEEVKQNLSSTGYPSSRLHYIKGMVEETIPSRAPETIALLRLDTDWYASVRHSLHHLYPRLVPGGVLIIDDYGSWEGARKAVDEYIAENDLRLFLHRLDDTGRLAIKT